jgi:hypothetical protein
MARGREYRREWQRVDRACWNRKSRDTTAAARRAGKEALKDLLNKLFA